jgi:hypothetical protein
MSLARAAARSTQAKYQQQPSPGQRAGHAAGRAVSHDHAQDSDEPSTAAASRTTSWPSTAARPASVILYP